MNACCALQVPRPHAAASKLVKTHASTNITRWSTDDVEPQYRIDYYRETVAKLLTPVDICASTDAAFFTHIDMMMTEDLSVIRLAASSRRVFRGENERARSGARTYHLMLSLDTPWTLNHRGSTSLEAGEAVLLDSEQTQSFDVAGPIEMAHFVLPASWIDRWLPNANVLVGRKLAAGTNWGKSLASFASVLSPLAVLNSPLPASLIAEHLGSMLALVAAEMSQVGPSRAEASLRGKVVEVLRQRCTEPELTAADVAAALNVSLRTVHRALEGSQETFGAALITSRLHIAHRMLESSLFKRVTVAEIGKRSGFCDASHFGRVFAAAYGMTPSAFRRSRRC